MRTASQNVASIAAKKKAKKKPIDTGNIEIWTPNVHIHTLIVDDSTARILLRGAVKNYLSNIPAVEYYLGAWRSPLGS